MHYNLEQLGPTGFQDLSAALLVDVVGADVQVMGPGSDGGRDSYYRGRIEWTPDPTVRATVWNGYTVFQVKHKRSLAAHPRDNLSWLWTEIRKELDAWSNPDGNRREIPQHLLFITNVPLTPTPGSGGHDSILTSIERYIVDLNSDRHDASDADAARRKERWRRLSSVENWQVWDGHKIQALLSSRGAVRRAFPAFFTAADVFKSLALASNRIPLSELEPGLRGHARAAMVGGDGLVYFDEAGGDTVGVPVHEVAFDLPIVAHGASDPDTAISYVLDRAERMLKPALTRQPSPRHIVLTGAPGNGKTTLSKFLVQVFRTTFMDGSEGLSSDQQRVIEGTKNALHRLGRRLPSNRRWAMRIDLAEYAQEGGLETDATLLRWIAKKISDRSDAGRVTPSALSSWMKQWPWFLVLDGLDEVTEPSTRKRLIEQLTIFVNEAEAEQCDVLVMVTTRPTGYTERIAPNHFERIDLDTLELTSAVRYGILATRVRLKTDVDRIDKVIGQLKAAAANDSLRNLLRTPLQVLILTIIIDGAGQLAPDRYGLFWNYYETIYRRERNKIGGFNYLLSQHGHQIQQLHERVGFELQVRSETADRSYATLSHYELRSIVAGLLKEDGFEPSGKHSDLVDRILTAATQRLVLIAPRGDEGFGFDVRSLQELTAARHLTTGTAQEILQRLRLAAPSPHWRNTWVFAAGRIFSEAQTHLYESLVHLIENIDASAQERLAQIFPIGPRLALEIVDDGMVRSLPRWRGRLMSTGLRVLSEQVRDDLASIARMLVRYADSGDDQRIEVAEGLREALGETAPAPSTVAKLQELIGPVGAELGALARTRALSHVKPRMISKRQNDPEEGWQYFDLEIETAALDQFERETAQRVKDAFLAFSNEQAVTEADVEAITMALDSPNVARSVESALAFVWRQEPSLVDALSMNILPIQYRRAIGDYLVDTYQA